MAGLTSTIVLSLVGWALYIVYCAIWRLYLSPIARFPGPRLAALTHWYELYYDLVKGGKYVLKIRELHEQYGRYRLRRSRFPRYVGIRPLIPSQARSSASIHGSCTSMTQSSTMTSMREEEQGGTKAPWRALSATLNR